jgi:hypothetical protein
MFIHVSKRVEMIDLTGKYCETDDSVARFFAKLVMFFLQHFERCIAMQEFNMPFLTSTLYHF